MAYCRYCGTNNNENAKFCTNCGSPLSSQPRREESKPYEKQQTQSQYARQDNWRAEPDYARRQPDEDSVQSQGQWVLDIFLICIPIVGLILLIVWSVTDQADLSKQRWARASLIWAIIGIVATMVIGVLFGALIAGLGTAYL